MKYLLIVQFSNRLLNYDDFISLEDSMIDALDEGADIDGHDIGADEANIFILTNAPEETFGGLIAVIENQISKENYRVAYRNIKGETYTILWPSDLEQFAVT